MPKPTNNQPGRNEPSENSWQPQELANVLARFLDSRGFVTTRIWPYTVEVLDPGHGFQIVISNYEEAAGTLGNWKIQFDKNGNQTGRPTYSKLKSTEYKEIDSTDLPLSIQDLIKHLSTTQGLQYSGIEQTIDALEELRAREPAKAVTTGQLILRTMSKREQVSPDLPLNYPPSPILSIAWEDACSELGLPVVRLTPQQGGKFDGAYKILSARERQEIDGTRVGEITQFRLDKGSMILVGVTPISPTHNFPTKEGDRIDLSQIQVLAFISADYLESKHGSFSK